jgi:hypothetical protein
VNARELLRLLRKPIRKVRLHHGRADNGDRFTDLQAIEFADGTALTLHVVELDADYAIEPNFWTVEQRAEANARGAS